MAALETAAGVSARRLPSALVAGLILATLLGAQVLWLVGHRFVPSSDWAVIELRTADVGTSATPLSGAWSRYGWNHPGPLLFYVLAMPYRVFGQDPRALLGAALAVNAVALGLVLWQLHRRGRSAFVLGLVALVLLEWGFSSRLLVDYWNASIVVIPFLLVAVAAWGVLELDPTSLPIVLLAWSWIAQCHLSYGVVALPLLAAGLVGWVRWFVQGERGGRRSAWIAGIVAGVLWLPVLVDVLANGGGNPRVILAWARSPSELPLGLEEAWRVIGQATALDLPWVRGWRVDFASTVTTGELGWVPFGALVMLGFAMVVATRHRWWDIVRLGILVALTWVTGLVAVARITGPLYVWILGWAPCLAMLTWLAVGMVVVRWCRLHIGGPARLEVGRLVLLTAAVVLAAVVVVTTAGDPFPKDELAEGVTALAAATLAWSPTGDRVLVERRASDPDLAGALESGLLAELRRAGLTPLVPPELGFIHGTHRTAEPGTADTVVITVNPTGPPSPGAEELTVLDTLPAEQRDAVVAERIRLSNVFRTNGWDSRLPLLETVFAWSATEGAPPAVQAEAEALARLSRLNEAGPEVVLYGVRAADG